MAETIPVRPDEAFSKERVAAFLRAASLPGFEPDHLEVEQFPAGQSNLTYLLRSGRWEGVLRRPPLGPIPPRAHDMAREFHILERIHPVFPLAPKPFVLCEDASVIGASFYVMQRRRGLVLDTELPADWQPDPRLQRRIAEALVQVLAELHAVDWRAAGLDGLGRPQGYLGRQLSGWIERYQRARTDDLDVVEPLAAWLSARLPESPPATVIHNDFKLNNVLLDPADPARLTAVLDWEMTTVGDPLSDVAQLLVYWTEPDEADLFRGLCSVTAQPGWPRRGEVAELYAQASGRPLGHLEWYLAFAFFKVAAIIQQIYHRWKVGQTQDARFASHGVLVANLMHLAACCAGLTER